ncbi:MAG: hypothetical protein ABGZ35_06115 [Planctomycetaceae bacterium]
MLTERSREIIERSLLNSTIGIQHGGKTYAVRGERYGMDYRITVIPMNPDNGEPVGEAFGVLLTHDGNVFEVTPRGQRQVFELPFVVREFLHEGIVLDAKKREFVEYVWSRILRHLEDSPTLEHVLSEVARAETEEQFSSWAERQLSAVILLDGLASVGRAVPPDRLADFYGMFVRNELPEEYYVATGERIVESQHRRAAVCMN